MGSRRVAALSIALVLCPSATWAGPSAADKDTARALMDQGEDQFERGDLQGALKSFLAADAIMHVPTTGIEVARTEAALGMLLEAQDAARTVARTAPKRGEPRPFTVARDAAKALDEDLDRRIPAIVIDVQPPPIDAPHVTIDGTELGAQDVAAIATGLARKVNPGHHVLEARAGDASAHSEIDVAERESKTVTLKLAAPPLPIVAAPPKPKEPPSMASDHPPNYPAAAAFAVASVGFGVGLVAGVSVLVRKSDLHDACNAPGGPSNTCSGSNADKLSTAKTLATVSDVGFIVAGVGLVTGIILDLRPRARASVSASASKASASKPSIQPWIGVATAGVNGHF